jgi:hypothetical protein
MTKPRSESRGAKPSAKAGPTKASASKAAKTSGAKRARVGQPMTEAERLARRYGTGERETGNSPANVVRKQAAMRWAKAHMLLNLVAGEDVSYAALGRLLAEKSAWRNTAYDQSMTYRLESGERAIRLEDVMAMVAVLNDHGLRVDPGWLAFGEASNAPPPDPALLMEAGRL